MTWAIPDDYGGMTAALLARSSAFARLGGIEVGVLTFDARPDTPALEQRLRDRGAIVDGVRIVNLYEWLRSNPLPGGRLRLDRDAFTPLGEDEADETTARGGLAVARIRRDAEGRVLQIDHLRDDGSLVLSDRRDTRQRGEPGGRSLVLCDADGLPVRSWRRAWPLYTAWLDALTASRPSFMIVDSKTIAPFMLGYRRSHVVTAHVVHASHRAGPGAEHPVRASRREVFEHLDDFDLVALLSRRQAAEVAELTGPHEHVAVIPNARPPREGASELWPRDSAVSSPRPVGAGIVLASLTSRKRVSDAIEAVASVRGGREMPLTLDVYGDGEERAALERLAAGTPGVELHGFAPDARGRLAERSFLLLTSRSEGFPLVLVEAMAAGCIPIAYDIRYGPADLIRHGRNGMLVPSGDVGALAAAIDSLQRMPPRKVAAMRRAAQRSARAFDERRVVATWARELSWARARRELRRSHRAPKLRAALQRVPFGARVRRMAVHAQAAVGRFTGAGPRSRRTR